MATRIVIVAVVSGVCSFFQVAFLIRTSQRQGTAIRVAFFKSLLRQHIGYYDSIETGVVTSHLSNDVALIQDAMGDKIGSYVQAMSAFIVGFVIAFYYSWKLTLVIMSFLPFLVGAGAVRAKLRAGGTAAEQQQYADAGGVAAEVLTLFRSVVAFGTEAKELGRYGESLEKARMEGIKEAKAGGFMMGFVYLVMYNMYALGMWFGSRMVRNGEMSGGSVAVVFFCILVGGFRGGQAAPAVEAIRRGKGAAVSIYKLIHKQSQIDALSETGKRPTSVKGAISFRNVSFAYPTRKDHSVFDGFNLDIPAQSSVAIVGESGCGKSTLVGLVERFYDPTQGQIFLDGVDTSDLNVQWLRSRVAMVAQQPMLFPTTIFENIAAGLKSRVAMSTAETEAAVEKAAKQANAHTFIESFPNGYGTRVGDAGAQLSGGQKQRIAIARALIDNPKILLLDEATSALDSRSEKVVQTALEKLQQETSRTTITIAHRLSTVRKCDKIIVLGVGGTILEQGGYDELLARGGMLAAMHAAQQTSDDAASLAADGTEEGGSGGVQANSLDGSAAENKVPKDNSGDDGPGCGETNAGTADGTKGVVGEGEDVEDEDKDPEAPKGMFKWAVQQSRPEWCHISFGLFASVVEGIIWPLYSLFLTQVIGELVVANDQTIIRNYCLGFVAIAVVGFTALFAKASLLGIAGNNLTQRLRLQSFESVLAKRVEWFDNPKNSKGKVTMRLASDASKVKLLVGESIGTIVSVSTMLIAGLTIGMTYCWQEALLMTAAIPVVVFFAAVQVRVVTGFSDSSEFEASSDIACQVVENIRTVVAMGTVKESLKLYAAELTALTEKLKREAFVTGVLYGITEMVMLLIWALAFSYGSYLVDQQTCTFPDMYTSIFVVVVGAMIGGRVTENMPDAKVASLATMRMYHLINGENDADGTDSSGNANVDTDGDSTPKAKTAPLDAVVENDCHSIAGKIEFVNVGFRYPSRPEVLVLKGLSFTINPGETVAFVGASGCGKSTIFSLLERFYRHESGSILVDGKEIESIEQGWLRKHIGLVQQEPQLFSCSIKDNIGYGLSNVPSMQQVEAAAASANASQFILKGTESRWRTDMEGQDGYDTAVGEKGMSLSGGQRQRIAIARALIRTDALKILLLDEATSALDTKSESVVQDALNLASAGRTTLVIAHRLSTIQNADRIIVMDHGIIIEQGTHAELVENQGPYSKLLKAQQH